MVVNNRVYLKLNPITFSLLMIIVSLISSILFSQASKAEVNSTTISWSNTKPLVFSSTTTPFLGQNFCSSFLQSKDLSGEDSPKDICINGNDKITFGIYYYGTGSYFLPAISFPFDSKMYKVNGICIYHNSCLYLPDSDTLVTKQYLINGIVKSLVVYKNFTDRLSKTINISNYATEYNLDSSNPDLIFQNSDNYAWPVGGIGASNNGKWLAVEFRQRGIGLLNIDTLQMRRISTYAYDYNSGMDPKTELAVSNDGEHIAIMGLNAGLKIFDIDQTCGDLATDDNMQFGNQIFTPCKESTIETGDFIYRFKDAYRPYFSDDGGELIFSATSYIDETKEVSLRAAGYKRELIDYLALGDSFSSGEGETDDKYYLANTNDEFEKCHVSSRSYPFLIASALNIDPLMVKSVACSGATTRDVVGDDSSYFGQGDRLISMGLNDTEITMAKNQASQLFISGRMHQNSFVKTYNPKVITIGIGGNDTGLMSKLKTCVGQGTCYYAATDAGKKQTAIEIKSLYGILVQTYQQLHQSSPKSKIYAIGYPKIIDSINKCDLLNGILLDNTERQFMNEGITYINQVIKAAVKTVGIGYADTQDSFGNQVICGNLSPSVMNAARIGDEGSMSESLDFIKIIGSESFHPTSLGHTLLANSIIKSAGNILFDDYCPDGLIICPIETPAPEPSNYWISETHHNYPAQKSTSYVYDREDNYDGRQKRVILGDNSLEPNSQVDMEITSTPKSLGNFQSSTTGSLTIDIDLPIDLEDGYHVIHLYGTSYSGESIELYQIIEYLKPKIAVNNQSETSTADIMIKQSEIEKNGIKEVKTNTNQDDEPQLKTQLAITKKIGPITNSLNSKEPTFKDEQLNKTITESTANIKYGAVMGISTVIESKTPTSTLEDSLIPDKDRSNYTIWHYVATATSLSALILITYVVIYKLKR